MAHNSEQYPISSNSRTKLSAFRFDDRTEESPEKSPSKVPLKPGHSDKENQASWLNGVVGSSRSFPGTGNSSTQSKDGKSIKECPQTPANRIPLADLISSTEDAVIEDPAAHLTPEDHVIWQHVPPSSNTDTKSRTPATSSKKRRHSSSPACSPQAGNSNSAQKEPFDLQSFQALLKTPQSDVAADLWNNYVEKHKVKGNGNIQLPRFENLPSSSPQTPASAKASRDSSGLRRSISCNAEWPTSRTKRRKIDDDDSKTARSLFSRTRSNVLDSGKSKSSRINFLVEQIEKTLQKPSEAPPSSSPLREHKDSPRSRSASPIERRALRASEKSNNQTDEHEACKDKGGLHRSSSEFGDDDFDQDLLDFAATSIDPFVETTQPRAVQPANSEGRLGLALNENSNPLKVPEHPDTAPMAPDSKVNIINENDGNDIDEFEDDYDGLPENLEEIAAAYDEAPESNGLEKVTGNDELTSQKPPLAAAAAPAPEGTAKAQEFSSGDEFDDDDFDLEAIEQSMNQSGEYGSNHVCHS